MAATAERGAPLIQQLAPLLYSTAGACVGTAEAVANAIVAACQQGAPLAKKGPRALVHALLYGSAGPLALDSGHSDASLSDDFNTPRSSNSIGSFASGWDKSSAANGGADSVARVAAEDAGLRSMRRPFQDDSPNKLTKPEDRTVPAATVPTGAVEEPADLLANMWFGMPKPAPGPTRARKSRGVGLRGRWLPTAGARGSGHGPSGSGSSTTIASRFVL